MGCTDESSKIVETAVYVHSISLLYTVVNLFLPIKSKTTAQALVMPYFRLISESSYQTMSVVIKGVKASSNAVDCCAQVHIKSHSGDVKL